MLEIMNNTVNLTETPTAIALLRANTCEGVHIAITDVRESKIRIELVEKIEELIFAETVDPIRFKLLQKIESIMNSYE